MNMRSLFLIPALVAGLPLTGLATSFSWTNTSSALENLSHGTAYTWGLGGTKLVNLEAALHSGQVITSATLTITNIYDWRVEPYDVLYVNILNGVALGTASYTYNSNPPTYDGTSYGPDFFNSTSTHLKYGAAQANSLLVYTGSYNHVPNPGTWSDPAGGSSTGFDLIINFTSANLGVLTGFLNADYGTAMLPGLGFSPDCHFYDRGANLTIVTGSRVPEGGATVILLAAGIFALVFAGRLLRRRSRGT